MRAICAFSIILASTQVAAQDAPAPSAPTYDEAIRCGFIGIAYGLRDEHDDATKREIVALGSRYMAYAEASSGKTTEAVVSDMGDGAGAIVEEVRQSAAPVTRMRELYEACAQRAAQLPEAHTADS